jgi:HAD superfamily hydrolase (TIGR01549 family)
MSPKGILLDLDDTLYEYEPAHCIALRVALDNIVTRTKVSLSSVEAAFDIAKKRLKSILPAVASGHSRILYFQLMFEELGLNAMPHAFHSSEVYWSAFLKNMALTADAENFLKRTHGIPVCLVTDLTAEIQYRKIEKLRLERYITHIVTSEEAGMEKPHPFMFHLGLLKLGLTHDDVIMVGDNFKKDIMGASFLGINSYWLNRSACEAPILPKGSLEIQSLDEVLL